MNKAEFVIHQFKLRGLTLGCAESITGGLFASTLVSIPGCSKIFKGGITCYSIESKIKLLGLSKETINKYGVVSEQVAKEMASHLKNKLNLDIAVSFTGNAGPSSEPGKEKVGVVYIAIAYKSKIKVFKKIYKGEREKIRLNAVNFALDQISEKVFLENFPILSN